MLSNADRGGDFAALRLLFGTGRNPVRLHPGMLSAFAGMRTIASGRKQTALPRDLLHTQTPISWVFRMRAAASAERGYFGCGMMFTIRYPSFWMRK